MIKGKYLTSAEVAKITGFSPDHIRRLILQGKIKAEKCGHSWLVAQKELKTIKRQRAIRTDKNGSDRSDQR